MAKGWIGFLGFIGVVAFGFYALNFVLTAIVSVSPFLFVFCCCLLFFMLAGWSMRQRG